MALARGDRLGPYEVEAAIGAGGMGEVYRARDTRLDRTVAIKVIAGPLAADPTLRQRFEREARAVAALAHPHICALYDVGREGDVEYLVMELCEGETLADRLARAGGSSATARRAPGALPLTTALEVAGQIAAALDAAHRRGIVHRDLKPRNVMLTRTGVKLLDFGLARSDGDGDAEADPALPAPAGADQSTAPSLTAPGAQMGTLPYMAPEQLEGKPADARADVYAMGTVMYEMLTGRRPFDGQGRATVIAAILEEEPPPMSSLASHLPPALERLVRDCLAKDPADRWQSAGDVARALAWMAEAAAPAPRAAPRARAWTLALALGAAGAVAGAIAARAGRAPAPAPRLHLSIPVEHMRETHMLALAPDGRSVAFVAADEAGHDQLWLRPLDDAASRPLAGTTGARDPFWSPDGASNGFAADGKLRRVPAAGGAPQVIGDAPGLFLGATWNAADTVLFALEPGGLARVAAGGGTPSAVTLAPPPGGEPPAWAWPWFLPDGRHFLVIDRARRFSAKEVYVASLDGGTPRHLLDATTAATFASGHLLFVRDRTLMAQPFDPQRQALGGEAFRVAEMVAQSSHVASAAVSGSRTGVLAYRTRSYVSQLTWFDAQGRKLGEVGERRRHESFDVSPDGRHIAFAAPDPRTGASGLWLTDARGATTPVDTGALTDLNDPVFAPDGERLAFTHRGEQPSIMVQRAGGGPARPLVQVPGSTVLMEDWSADGRWIAFGVLTGGSTKAGGVAPADGGGAPRLFSRPDEEIDELHFSPDARFVAYNVRGPGAWEVYVSAVPPGAQRWQISVGGGVQPRWRRDGRRLYYLAPDGAVMAVDVSTASGVQAGPPRRLFATDIDPSGYVDQYAASPDGERFLVGVPVPRQDAAPIEIVVNWTARPQ
jgi:dipeptidyl aminopeptidase/acylaminoacyl peptidase